MPPLGQRQIYGIFILLLALFAVLAIDRAVALYAVGLSAVAIVVVVWTGSVKAGI